MICHACGHENRDGARFCEECGQPQIRRCPSCHHEVSPTAKFCSECGERLGPIQKGPVQKTPAQKVPGQAVPGQAVPSQKGPSRRAPTGTDSTNQAAAAKSSANPAAARPAAPPARSGRPLWGPDPADSTTEHDSGAGESAPEASVVAERRQLTVMFCDLVGSTVLSRRLDPEHLRDVIQAYQSAAAEQIRTFGGYIAQYLGDGLLVYFGYPTAYEDAALRAVHASLAIVDAMGRLSQKLRADKEVELQVRIGIHTGLVVIGDVGAGGRHERLAMGDTPNVAARIEGQAPPGGVLISSATYQLMGQRVRVLDLGPQQLKGLEEPIKLFRVLGDSAQEELETRLASRVSKLVGRSSERQMLLDLWLKAQGERGQAVYLHGEAGIGKSRLVQSLRGSVGGAFRRLELRCSPLFRHSPLYPFIGLLQRSADITPDDPGPERWRKLKRLAHRHGIEGADIASVLAPMLSIAPPDADLEPLPPAERRERTRDLLLQFLFSSSDPTLIVFEDLDWIDPTSREVLEAALEAIERRPLLLVLTGRAGAAPWADDGQPHRHQVALTALEQEQVEQLIRHVAGRELPRGLVRLLSDRADGVPVFVEELTRMVIETGLLEQGEETLDGTRSIRRLAIPSTLQDSLLARLDRLGTAKGVVQIASTIGREFDFPLLEQVTEAATDELIRDLARLQHAGILLAEGEPPTARYLFKSALLRDAAYGSLLRSHRVSLHRTIGQTLESRGDDQNPVDGALPATELDLLAYHWARSLDERRPDAQVAAKAAGYCGRAGEVHLRGAAYHEAGSLLEEAQDLVALLPEGRDRDERELALLLHLGNVYRSTVGWVSEEVLRTAERARELCERLGDRPELAPVLHGLWQFYLVRGEFAAALKLARDCHSLAEETDDEDLRLEAHVALANTQFWIGDLVAAERHASEVLQIYDAERHAHHAMSYGQDPRVLGFMFEVWSLQLLGRLDEAVDQHLILRQLAAEMDHPYMTAIALNISGSFYLDLRDAEQTRIVGESMGELAREVGFPHWQLAAEIYRAWGLAHSEPTHSQNVADSAAALEISRDGYRRWPEVIGGMGRTFAGRIFAEVCLRQDDKQVLQEGLDAVESCLEIVEQFGEGVYAAELFRLRGLLRRRLGGSGAEGTDIGLEDLQAAFDRAESQGLVIFALRAATELARHHPEMGTARLQRCLEKISQNQDCQDLRDARQLLR